jgi:hypothetical protein
LLFTKQYKGEQIITDRAEEWQRYEIHKNFGLKIEGKR